MYIKYRLIYPLSEIIMAVSNLGPMISEPQVHALGLS